MPPRGLGRLLYSPRPPAALNFVQQNKKYIYLHTEVLYTTQTTTTTTTEAKRGKCCSRGLGRRVPRLP